MVFDGWCWCFYRLYPCYIRLQTFFVFVKNANVWILYITAYVHIDMNYPLIASVFWSPSSVILLPFWSRPDVWLKSLTSVASSRPHLDAIVIRALLCAYLLACWYPHVCVDQKSCRQTPGEKQTAEYCRCQTNAKSAIKYNHNEACCIQWFAMQEMNLCVIVNHHRICWDGINIYLKPPRSSAIAASHHQGKLTKMSTWHPRTTSYSTPSWDSSIHVVLWIH